MGKDPEDGRGILDCGDDLQPATAVWAALNVNLVKMLYPGVSDEAQLGRDTVRDLVFTTFARRIAYLHSRDAPTWRYYFSYVPTNLRSRAPGVPHGGEIVFVMGTGDGCACLEAAHTDADRTMSRRVGDYWSAFARTGVPSSSGGPAWPRDGVETAQTMEFGDAVTVRTDFMRERLNVFIGTLNVLGAVLGRE